MRKIVIDTLAPEEIEVEITDSGKQYVLVTATEDVRIKYRESVSSGVTFNENGIPSCMPPGLASSQAVLVQGCLFEVLNSKDGERKLGPVSMGFVKNLPGKVVRQLFDAARELGDIDADNNPEAMEAQAKKLQEQAEKIRKDGNKAKN